MLGTWGTEATTFTERGGFWSNSSLVRDSWSVDVVAVHQMSSFKQARAWRVDGRPPIARQLMGDGIC